MKVLTFPSRQKPVQSQKNNVRATFSERCSNVILLTLNRFWPAWSGVNLSVNLKSFSLILNTPMKTLVCIIRVAVIYEVPASVLKC